MDKHKLAVRLAVGLTVVILFGGTGYLGYRFIQDVSRSADNIQANVTPVQSSDLPVNNQTLSMQNQMASAVDLSQLQPAQDGVSSGQDVAVKAGDFAYQHGVPQVRLALVNQGGFTVGGVFVRLNLYLDGSEQAVGEPVIVQTTLPTPLAVGQETQTQWQIDEPAWRSAAVAEAKSRRVVAQIVGVNDKDSGGMDYPQISKGVLLRQTKNDWSKPFNPNDAVGVMLNETASQVAEGSPNIEVFAEQPPMPPTMVRKPDDFREMLEPTLPTGESRILSVEVQEYQNGELVQSERAAEKE